MNDKNLTLTSANVCAILKNRWARDRLLVLSSLSERDWTNYHSLDAGKKLLAQQSAISVMIEYPYRFDTYGFPHPLNTADQMLDPIKIYGARGVWLVHDDFLAMIGKFTFFGLKKEAFRHATRRYKEFLDEQGVSNRASLVPYQQ